MALSFTGKLKQNHENPLRPIIILLGNIMALLLMAIGNKIMKNHPTL
jgi:hypothetical protein